jgi:hypothetical protein
MKILKKIIIVLLLGIMVFGIRIYLNGEYGGNDSSVEFLGQSSSWLYRKVIEIENEEGKRLHEPEIMIVLNTKELINSGKLLENCNDIRFLDSDNSTLLKHRIESGCNTEETKIFVKFSSLPSDGTVIYFYYGNPYASPLLNNSK